MRHLTLFFLLIFFVSPDSEAQVNLSSKSVLVEGFISNSGGKYIENVHVVDISGNRGTTSNWEGQFRIIAFPGDTIRFTCVGYIPFRVHVPFERQTPVVPLHIVLQVDTLQISGVNIYPWPADARALKEALLAMEDQTPKVPDLKLNDPLYKASDLPTGSPPSPNLPGMSNPGLTYSIPGPITALYNAFSKTAKSQRKFESLVNDDQKKIVAASRYNPQVIRQITSFRSDKEIQDFMLYCNLSVDFIISSTEYNLYKAIHECLLAYNDSKKAKI